MAPIIVRVGLTRAALSTRSLPVQKSSRASEMMRARGWESWNEALVDKYRRDTWPVIHCGGEQSRVCRTREVQCGTKKVQQSLQSCLRKQTSASGLSRSLQGYVLRLQGTPKLD